MFGRFESEIKWLEALERRQQTIDRITSKLAEGLAEDKYAVEIDGARSTLAVTGHVLTSQGMRDVSIIEVDEVGKTRAATVYFEKRDRSKGEEYDTYALNPLSIVRQNQTLSPARFERDLRVGQFVSALELSPYADSVADALECYLLLAGDREFGPISQHSQMLFIDSLR